MKGGFLDCDSPYKNNLRGVLVHGFIQTLQILAYVMQCAHKAVRVLKLKWFFWECGGESWQGEVDMWLATAHGVLQMRQTDAPAVGVHTECQRTELLLARFCRACRCEFKYFSFTRRSVCVCVCVCDFTAC